MRDVVFNSTFKQTLHILVQHTHSVPYCCEAVKKKQERTRLFEDYLQEQRIKYIAKNGLVLKKKQEQGKTRSNKPRAGENKLVCHRSLTRLLAGPDERHTKQRDCKAKWEAKTSTLQVYIPRCPSAWGHSKERSQDVWSQSQHNTHRKATSTTMASLQRQPCQHSLVLRRTSIPLWKETAHVWHTQIHWFVHLPSLKKPLLNGHMWFKWL